MLPSYRAITYAGLGLKTVVKLYKKTEFRLEGYVFQPYQDLKRNPLDQTASFGLPLSDRAFIGSAALVYNSPVGPFSLGVNYYDKAAEHFTVNINIGYILFNRKPLPQ